MSDYNASMVTLGAPESSSGGRFIDLGGFVSASGGGKDAPLLYRMRGFDQGLGKDVYWTAQLLDYEAAYYTGGGPVLDVKVFKVIPGKNT